MVENQDEAQKGIEEEEVPEEGNAQIPAMGNNYQDMIIKMKEYSSECVRRGELLEAEQAQMKIEMLKDEEYNVQRSEIIHHNEKEMTDLLAQREEQTRDFEQQWQEHGYKLEEDCEAELEALEQRQMGEMQERRDEIESKLSEVYKPSSKLLQLRHLVPRLIQQKKYVEAHGMQGEIAGIEQKEQVMHMKNREKRVIKKVEHFIGKQVIERESLEKKLKNQQYEQRSSMDVETETLRRKFENAIMEMDNRHNLELSKFDKAFEKTIANRPRYEPINSVSSQSNQSISMRSFRSNASRSALFSQRSGRSHPMKQM